MLSRLTSAAEMHMKHGLRRIVIVCRPECRIAVVAHQSIIRYMLDALTDGQPAAFQYSLEPCHRFANCEMRGHTFVGPFWQEVIDNHIHDLLQDYEEWERMNQKKVSVRKDSRSSIMTMKSSNIMPNKVSPSPILE